MDIKSAAEKYWVKKLKAGGAERVYAGRCDDIDVDTPFIVCRCEEAPVTIPGGGAHRVDPFEILVISHINESNSLNQEEAVGWVRSIVECSAFPNTDAGVQALGRGPLKIRNVANEDDERYADIVEFVFGFVLADLELKTDVPKGLTKQVNLNDPEWPELAS